MFITKKHLSRRTFLRGAGVTVALPFLESMVPAQTPLKNTAASPKTRLGCIYVPHGATMYKWTPEKEGAGFDFSEADQVPPAQFNRVLWTGLMGNKPYPARRVQGSGTKDEN